MTLNTVLDSVRTVNKGVCQTRRTNMDITTALVIVAVIAVAAYIIKGRRSTTTTSTTDSLPAGKPTDPSVKNVEN